MESEKNLHATIPPALLAKVEQVADAEHITVDELILDAVLRRLDAHEWRELLAFGERHARSLHLTEKDVLDVIAEVRRSER